MKVTNAVLVVPVISFWEANKKSKKGSKEIAELHHIEDKTMARVWKSLFPASAEYAKLKEIRSAIRTFVYTNTLAGSVDGERLLPTTNYKFFMEGIRQLKGQFEAAVAEFVKVYPQMVEKAKGLLNGLFEEADYPAKEAVACRFGVTMKIRPVPVADHFTIDLETDDVEMAREEAAKDAKNLMDAANKELWYRLHDAVNDIAQRLNKSNGRIVEATLENLDELLDVMSRLNVSEDANLEALMAQTKEKLLSLDVEAYKKTSPERVVAAQDAEDIVNAMAAFMGVA